MKKIDSFTINHDILVPGIYISRKDYDITTYDLRFKHPNKGDYLENPSMHTLEHLIATYVRNSRWKDRIIYFGPMGCRTGFYLLMRDVSHGDAVLLIKNAVEYVMGYKGKIPGATPPECGNYREHDLEKAIEDAGAYYEYIKSCSPDKLQYP